MTGGAHRVAADRVMRLPDAGAVERFRADFLAVAGPGAPQCGRIGVAVSGGPDSMALLLLAHAAFPGRVAAATVDHRLRPEAAEEAAMVAAQCRALAIAHATLTADIAHHGASVQARARDARYGLLHRWAVESGADMVATAHHADDQAETLLMRIARGSGAPGLAAIRAARPLAAVEGLAPVRLVRPLFGWRKAELRALVADIGAPFVDDPSNGDMTYDRARFRALLAAHPELDPHALTAAAAHAAEAEDALAALADFHWRERAAMEGAVLSVDVAGMPREIRRRLARRAIGAVRTKAAIGRPAWSDAANVEPLLDALEQGGGATQAGVMAHARGDRWDFRPAPPRRPGPEAVRGTGGA